MKHYWLCSRCCEGYTIEYHKGLGLLLLQRLETVAAGQPGYYVLQEEILPKPVVPRRVKRARARQKKGKAELTPVAVTAIEILETRNLERMG